MELWLTNTFLPLLLLTWLPVGTASELGEPGTTVQCEICLENLTMQVNRYKLKCLEVKNQTNIVVPGENCMNFTSSNMSTAHTGICMCRVFITRPNSTDTGNSTQAAVLSCGSAESQTNVTEKIWTGLNLLLCILFGFAVGTLLYMPVIGFLLWQCRRNRTGWHFFLNCWSGQSQAWEMSIFDILLLLLTLCSLHKSVLLNKLSQHGELMSGEVVKGNQVSMVAPVTGTADLTYANLNFRNKGTGSASSNVIYTEIKPSQQKQSGGDGSAASTEVDVSPKEEGE